MAWKKQIRREQNRQALKAVKERKHIMVGIPIEHADQGLGVGVYRFLHMLQELNTTAGHPFRYTWQMVIDKLPVEWARNLIVGMFLKTDAEKLWFIDNDMIPDADALRMLKVDADIVAGLALAFDHGNKDAGKKTRLKLCLFRHAPDEDTFYPIVPEPGHNVVEVDAAGTATMLIDRKVLKDRRMWHDTEYRAINGARADLNSEMQDPDWGPPVFRFIRKPNGKPLRGEDMDFSWRAKQLGYKVVGCPGIRFGHNKTVNLDTVLDLVNQTTQAYGASIMKEIEDAHESAPEGQQQAADVPG